MPVDAIGGAQEQEVQQPQQTVVNQEDLFKILLTQLSYQDPLEPMDNKEFIAQLAQFTSLEQSRQMSDKLESMLALHTADQSINLIGKTVEVATATGSEVGEVTTIRFDQGHPLMTVRTASGTFINDVSLSQISVVQ